MVVVPIAPVVPTAPVNETPTVCRKASDAAAAGALARRVLHSVCWRAAASMMVPDGAGNALLGGVSEFTLCSSVASLTSADVDITGSASLPPTQP